MIKRVLRVLAGLVALLVAVLAVNTLRQGSRQLVVPPAPPAFHTRRSLPFIMLGSRRKILIRRFF